MSKPSHASPSRLRAVRLAAGPSLETPLARIEAECALHAAMDPLARQAALVVRIERALRAERARGRAGHRTYDLVRHAALARALAAERARLRSIERGCRAGRIAPGPARSVL